jgi:7,8-dihydroneopterin aldolase/epimerase/oxygenase
MDRVFLEKILLPTRIGVTPAERAVIQMLEADIALACDLEKAGLSDSLDDAPDYSKLRRLAVEVAAARAWSLLEALAERIAAETLVLFPAVASVTVTLRKPSPPFMEGVGAAGVRIVRRRPPYPQA